MKSSCSETTSHRSALLLRLYFLLKEIYNVLFSIDNYLFLTHDRQSVSGEKRSAGYSSLRERAMSWRPRPKSMYTIFRHHTWMKMLVAVTSLSKR